MNGQTLAHVRRVLTGHFDRALILGSLETLAVEIRNGGAANNLDSAHVNIFYDNSRFYELCKARCGGGCAAPPM